LVKISGNFSIAAEPPPKTGTARPHCCGRAVNLATTYSRGTYRPTTIGAAAFHFRVRDGNGWFHRAMVTRGGAVGELLVMEFLVIRPMLWNRNCLPQRPWGPCGSGERGNGDWEGTAAGEGGKVIGYRLLAVGHGISNQALITNNFQPITEPGTGSLATAYGVWRKRGGNYVY